MRSCRILIVSAAVVALSACSSGTKSSADKSSTSVTSGSTTTTLFSGRDGANLCALDEQFHSRYDSVLGNPNASVIALRKGYEQAVQALAEMERIASSEIKPTVATMHLAAKGLLPSLVRARFVQKKLDTAGQAIMASQANQRAAQRLVQYETEVCHRKLG